MMTVRSILAKPTSDLHADSSRSGSRSVDEILVGVCRAVAEELADVEVVVDCDPARLEIRVEDVGRFARCASLLLDAARAGRSPAEIDVSAQVAGTIDAPLLLFSVRTLAVDSSRLEEPAAWAESGPVRIARINTQRAPGTLLVSHRNSSESRFSLGLEIATSLASRAETASIQPLEAKILIADDNSRGRRACRRLLEAEGYTVLEATRPLELVAQLDPDETMGVPPAWLLIDGDWVGSGRRSRVGLVDLVEASLPADRILLLGGAGGREPAGPEAWGSLAKPFTAAELLERIRLTSPQCYLRNAEAEMPYSLSR